MFSYEDLQKAARRDVRWLELSSDTLEARLQGVQQALQVTRMAECWGVQSSGVVRHVISMCLLLCIAASTLHAWSRYWLV